MDNTKLYDKYFTEILITEEQISKKILEMAKWIDQTYKNSNALVLIGLLKGSIPFIAQLMNKIETNHSIDFMTVSSFDGQISSTGNIKMIMDLKHDINNKDVLIVEDIIDSGKTLSKVISILKTRKPRTLKVITLLDKPAGRIIPLEVDMFGFIVPNKFLVGFGLDVKEKLRNVPYIGVFDQTKIDEL